MTTIVTCPEKGTLASMEVQRDLLWDRMWLTGVKSCSLLKAGERCAEKCCQLLNEKQLLVR